MQGNVVKAAVWVGASMVLASVVLVVGLYVVVSSQAQRMEQALLKARGPVETTIKFSGLDSLKTTYEGVTLPSAKSIVDDVQYFPKTPDFQWANTSDATQRLKAMLKDCEADGESVRDIPAEASAAKQVAKLLSDSEAMRVGLETIDTPPAPSQALPELQFFPVGQDREPKLDGDDE